MQYSDAVIINIGLRGYFVISSALFWDWYLLLVTNTIMASIPRFNVTGRYRMLHLQIPNHSLGDGEESSVKNGARFFGGGDTPSLNLTRGDENKSRPNTAASQVILRFH